jgi:hypothetical protein
VGNISEIFALYGKLAPLSRVLGLEWSLVDGFVDFGWIFLLMNAAIGDILQLTNL